MLVHNNLSMVGLIKLSTNPMIRQQNKESRIEM